MLRALVVILVLANLAFYGWTPVSQPCVQP
jgi:hypothetical protein